MLLSLHIENIAIIERLELSLSDGFTVFSGETGAGKSVLIEALNALVGGRTSRDLVRTGADRAAVQGLFEVPDAFSEVLFEYGINQSDDGLVILQRNFTETGRNACRINGTLVAAGVLRLVGEKLVDIHGQHDSLSLFRPETHLGLLDAFAGTELRAALKLYQAEYELWCRLKNEWKQTYGTERERERRIDMLKFQVDELEKASLKSGEDLQLEQKSSLFAHAETIVAAFSEAWDQLSGGTEGEPGARERIKRAAAVLRKVGGISPQFYALAEGLIELAERLDDISGEVLDIRDNTEYDPKERDIVEERLTFLQGIRRKYGDTVEDCINYYGRIKEELEKLTDTQQSLSLFQARLNEQAAKLSALSEKLHEMRLYAATELAQGMAGQLEELEMPNSAFEAVVAYEPDREFDEYGLDKVEFLFTANVGEPLKSLSRIASGGELARVMLALKTILADADKVPTLIFDEIDSGVGGKAAKKVGDKLANMAKSRQVICVTHHAQVASLAANHFLIGKKHSDGRTRTSIIKVEGKARESEITRLLSGDHQTETAQGLARELLQRGIAEVKGKK